MSSDPLASIRGRIGGLALSAQRDARGYTRAARSAFMNRFEVQVDPEGALPPAERARRAEAARKLYFQRLALKSAKTRRRKAGPQRRANGDAP